MKERQISSDDSSQDLAVEQDQAEIATDTLEVALPDCPLCGQGWKWCPEHGCLSESEGGGG